VIFIDENDMAELRCLLQEKDDEIERLQGLLEIDPGEIKRLERDLEYSRSCFQYQLRANEKFAKLITELRSALEAKTSCVEYNDIALCERARDAVL
jgi:hypothetical protein